MRIIGGALLMIVVLIAMVANSCKKGEPVGETLIPPINQNIDAE